MPLYLVRWPDLAASLVRAEGEDELVYILDQVANPDDCEWSVYEGPVFVDFELPVEWSIRRTPSERRIEPEQIAIDDLGLLATTSVVTAMELDVASGDDGSLMAAEVVRIAFPELHEATEKQYEIDPDWEGGRPLPEADLRDALREELLRLLRASWNRTQVEGDDEVSALARQLDLPVSMARKFVDMATAQHGNGQHESGEPSRSGRSGAEPLFQVSNHHTSASGQPPAIDGDTPGMYLGYFANEHGEQAIFLYDYETGEAKVQMGEAGWDKAHSVEDGRVEGLKFTEAEAAWIRACWLAACGL